MNILASDFRKYEACREQGFIHLDWQEVDDEIVGGHFHSAWVVGKKVVLHVSLEHKSYKLKTQRKIYEVRLGFNFKSELGDDFYLNQPHTEYDLESAMEYGQWHATLIFKFIEGDDKI
jgi:hypothetical protein